MRKVWWGPIAALGLAVTLVACREVGETTEPPLTEIERTHDVPPPQPALSTDLRGAMGQTVQEVLTETGLEPGFSPQELDEWIRALEKPR
jgi:hypothetical protein